MEDKELLTELCIEREGGINTSEELVIKVIVSKAKTVEVTCAFQLQNNNDEHPSSSQFVLNVEDNLSAKEMVASDLKPGSKIYLKKIRKNNM